MLFTSQRNKTYKIGLVLFYIGIFLLPSSLGLSIIIILFSSIIGLFIYPEETLKDKWNIVLIIISFFMVTSSVFNTFFNETIYTSDLPKSRYWLDLFNWIPLFLCFIGSQKYLRNEKDREITALIMISGSIPVIFTGIAQYFFNLTPGVLKTFFGLITWYQEEVKEKNGLSGLFSNPNYASSWLNIIWPFCIASALKTKKRINKSIQILITIFVFLCTILTNSRAGSGGLLITFLMLPELKIIRRFSPFVIFFFIGQITTFIPQLFLKAKDYFKDGISIKELFFSYSFESSNEVITRFDIWMSGIRNIINNPFFGSGSGSFTAKFLYDEGVIRAHSHNLPLELAINFGIPVSILLSTLVITISILSIKTSFLLEEKKYLDKIFDKAWSISLLVLTIGHLVDIPYFDGRISIGGWILLAGSRNIIRKRY